MIVVREDDSARRVDGFTGQRGGQVVLAPNGVLPVGVSAEARREEASGATEEYHLACLRTSVTNPFLAEDF